MSERGGGGGANKREKKDARWIEQKSAVIASGIGGGEI